MDLRRPGTTGNRLRVITSYSIHYTKLYDGLTRYINIASRLTGWNAVKYRAEQLGLDMSDAHIKHITREIKQYSDERPFRITSYNVCYTKLLRDCNLVGSWL